MKKVPVKYKDNLVGYTKDGGKTIDFLDNKYSEEVINYIKNSSRINISSKVSENIDEYDEHNIILKQYII